MAGTPISRTYGFEDLQLDPGRNLLVRLPDGAPVPLTNKAFQVLLLLVANHGKLLTKEELIATVWPDSVVEEANVTQTISVLRRALGETPDQHRFIVTEPGQGYRFVAKVREVVPEPAETGFAAGEGALPGPASMAPETRILNVRLMYGSAAAGILIVFVILGALYLWNRPQSQTSNPSSAKEVRSIAVLPFRSIDANEDRLLGIGMADAVFTKLSRLRGIVVRDTGSVIRVADATPEAVRVGREINVDAVVEGIIQQAEGRIRVSVRLLRVSDGALLWADKFDERETDIFTLQDSISERVANSLSLELDPDERTKLKRRYTNNVEAYELYNKARFFWNNRSPENLRKSIDLYQQAIALDPNYSLAYAGLAESYVVLEGFNSEQERYLFPKGREAAEKALSLDENLEQAHTALAIYREQYEWDWPGAEAEFKRAIAINPNYAIAHQWYGEFLAFMGRTAESVAEVEKAAELDPQSLEINAARAFPHIAGRNWEQAIAKAKAALELEAELPLARYYLARGYDGIGRHQEAVAEYRRAIAGLGRSTYFTSGLIYGLVKSGQRAEAERIFADLSADAKQHPISRYILARSLAALGRREAALDELERAFAERDALLMVIKIDQNLDDIRDDPRFQQLLKKMRF